MDAERAPLISIVVTNHNYAAYLPQCLESVAAQTYPHVECIVVDDGSTDGSREIIARYPQFTPMLQANTGHAIAAQNGFRASTGAIILFLDSDDFLFPDACAEIARRWTADLVSFHYRLQIFKDGAFEHRYWPDDRFRVGAEQLDCLFRFGFVPAAPTSGNAYARGFIETIFREATGLTYNSIDSCLAYAAPVMGTTMHSERALGAYRVHGSNLSQWDQKRPVSKVKLGQFYNYHAQMTARRLAKARNMAVPAWEFLNGPYDLKLYLLMRGVPVKDVELPIQSPLPCAAQSARLFLAMTELSWIRRAGNVAIVYLLALSPLSWRRTLGERFYKLDYAR